MARHDPFWTKKLFSFLFSFPFYNRLFIKSQRPLRVYVGLIFPLYLWLGQFIGQYRQSNIGFFQRSQRYGTRDVEVYHELQGRILFVDSKKYMAIPIM
jgi:hypothetical protein